MPFKPDIPVQPGLTLKEAIEYNKIPIVVVCEKLGISEYEFLDLILGYKTVDKNIAKGLSELISVREEMWLKLQHSYDEDIERMYGIT